MNDNQNINNDINQNQIETPVEQTVEPVQGVEPVNTIQPEASTIVQPSTPVMNIEPEKPKKKKKGLKGFIIFLIVVLIIGGLIFGGIKLYKHLTYVEDPFPDIDTIGVSKEHKDSFLISLESDYKNGVINKDQYLMQLAYSIFEPAKLDVKYNSLDINYVNPNDLFDMFIDSKEGELSPDTAAYISKLYFMDYIQWESKFDFDDEKSSKAFSPMIKKVANDNPTTLNKVKLSKNKNFLIYYTTTGENAVSEETASVYGDFLESHVKNIKKVYGLDFKYEQKYTEYTQTPAGIYAKICAAQLLTNNGIDLKYMDSALPVYLINMYDLDVPAFYTPATDNNSVTQYLMTMAYTFPELAIGEDYTEEELKQFRYQTGSARFTYAFPYIVLNASTENVDDIKLLSAHELFHHYQQYICGDGKYAECASDRFTTETTANLVAINVANAENVGTQINNHAYQVNYYKLMESSIDAVGFGYGAYVFAYNYSNIVPNGAYILNQSMKYEDPLSYIYKNSKGKYKDALLTTAEKNLTLDYKNKQVLPYEIGNTWSLTYPTAHGDINVNHREAITDSSMHYFYVDPSTLGESKIYFKAGEQTPHELTLLLFVKEDNKYKKVYSHNLDEKFVIKASDWTAYDEIAFAIVETSITNDNAYYNLETSTIIKDDATVTPKSLGLKEPDQSKKKANTIMCYQIEDTDYFKTGYQVLINLDKDQNIDNMLMKGTLKVKDNVIVTKAFDAAKKIAPGIILGIKLRYKQMLKNVRITTTETDDSWTILFKVTKDYDGAFTSSFGPAGNSKEEIINTIKAKGFICE